MTAIGHKGRAHTRSQGRDAAARGQGLESDSSVVSRQSGTRCRLMDTDDVIIQIEIARHPAKEAFYAEIHLT